MVPPLARPCTGSAHSGENGAQWRSPIMSLTSSPNGRSAAIRWPSCSTRTSLSSTRNADDRARVQSLGDGVRTGVCQSRAHGAHSHFHAQPRACPSQVIRRLAPPSCSRSFVLRSLTARATRSSRSRRKSAASASVCACAAAARHSVNSMRPKVANAPEALSEPEEMSAAVGLISTEIGFENHKPTLLRRAPTRSHSCRLPTSKRWPR